MFKDLSQPYFSSCFSVIPKSNLLRLPRYSVLTFRNFDNCCTGQIKDDRTNVSIMTDMFILIIVPYFTAFVKIFSIS